MVLHENNDRNIFFIHNDAKDFQLSCIDSILLNQISFLYEQRLYKNYKTEEHYVYYSKISVNDYDLVSEFSSNYTIAGKDKSSVDAPVLSQEKARYVYLRILEKVNDLYK